MFLEHLWFLDCICGVREECGAAENTLLTSCLSCAIPSISREIDFVGDFCRPHVLIAFIINSVLSYCCSCKTIKMSEHKHRLLILLVYLYLFIYFYISLCYMYCIPRLSRIVL